MTISEECYKKAIRLLTARDYSRPKLCKKLVSVGFDEDESRACCEKLYQDGLLKEQWYIEARIKGFMRKNYSPKHIKQRLAQEDLVVSEQEIQEIFQDQGQSESEQLMNLIEKKGNKFLSSWDSFSREDRYKIKMKIVRAIVAKGFSPNQGLTAIERYFNQI